MNLVGKQADTPMVGMTVDSMLSVTMNGRRALPVATGIPIDPARPTDGGETTPRASRCPRPTRRSTMWWRRITAFARTAPPRERGTSLPTALRGLCLALLVVSMIGGVHAPGGASAADGTGTVYTHFHGCKGNEAAHTQDHASLDQWCTESTYYVTFDLTSEGTAFTGEQQDGVPADVRFDDVPAHAFSLTGQFGVYAGAAVVYCQNGEDPGTVDGYELMDVAQSPQGSVVHPTMGSAGYVTCDWYGTAAAALTNTGTISISAWQCPDGFDLAGAHRSALSTTCAAPLNGVDFSAESVANPSTVKTTGTDANGRVFFSYVNADFVQITGAREGAATPRVFCGGTVENGTSAYPTTEIPAINATFPYNLVEGEALSCDWYDVPAARATVYVNVHLCPSGPDLSQADMNTLAASCKQSMNGVAFGIVPENQGATTALSGESTASGVLWQDMAPGKATIGETPMAGFTARVFCDQALPGESGAAHYTEREVGVASFSTTLDPGEELVCDWFNLNDGGVKGTGGVDLFAFGCPAGLDATASNLGALKAACTTKLDGVGFTLAAEAGDLVDVTGSVQEGAVIFYDVPAQGAVVVAGPPDGYATGAVYCGQALDYQGKPTASERMATVDTNAIEATIAPGAQEICRWFFSNGKANAGTNPDQGPVQVEITPETGETDGSDGTDGTDQTDDGQPTTDDQGADAGSGDVPQDVPATSGGTVTVINHLCPSGFDAVNADVASLYEQCTGDGTGFGFALTTEGIATYQTSGDTIGQGAVWTSVPAHTFTIEEVVPDGYGAAGAACTASTGESSYLLGSAIHPTVPEGGSLTCDWFTAQS